jgi:hypothetical protein
MSSDSPRTAALSQYADTWRRAYWAHREVPGRHRGECCQDKCWPDIAERVVDAIAPSIAADLAEVASFNEPPAEGLREALARAIEGGYTEESIDPDLYHNDPVYHAIVWEIRKQRLAVTEKDWQEHAALASHPTPSTTAEGLDVERLGFYDLLDVADALLRRYPPDTIVCSHRDEADPGARTVAAIKDLVDSCRLTTPEPETEQQEGQG